MSPPTGSSLVPMMRPWLVATAGLTAVTGLLYPVNEAFSLASLTSLQRRWRHHRPQTPASQQPSFTLLAIKGDPLRDATNIRPSLHPVTINAIAEGLRIRSKNLDEMPLRKSDKVEPLQIAMAAGRIASEAIHKRQEASSEDGMELRKEEEQVIAGRVVGVIMRLDELEGRLHQKCSGIPWVAKYNEWATFGLLPSSEEPDDLDDRILSDPLFRMSRAECLLALFLDTVETPSLKKSGKSVPGGSAVDFLDADRKEVLLDD